MPPEIGGWFDGPPTQSAVDAGMLDWVDDVRTIDHVLIDVPHGMPCEPVASG